tara:strand:- start:1560 stop:1970 length:411 start_codon:yes stop_codon:yes gene_type:complete
MSKKKTQEWISFVEKGQRWMICKSCQSEYVKADEETAAVTCSSCVIKKTLALKPLDDFFAKKRVSTGRPAGWHFMNEFVDKDGNVFHKGKEQPELKGTLEPTKVKPRKKRKKLSADEKLFKKAADWKKRKKARRAK